jgi:SAM-dependent methyltransferase
MDPRKLLSALNHPQKVLKGVADRVRYPRYKQHVGPPELYSAIGRHQFELLQLCGLSPNHSVLDIGCGSLRAGGFIIRYLEPGKYFGIEPNRNVLRDGITHNLDKATLENKRPTFSYDTEFNLSLFGRQFDFLLAHSIFTHAAQHQIKKCFVEARRVMSAESVFLANYNRADTNYAGMTWVYPSHVAYTFAGISALAQEAELRCLELDREHPTGSLWILACNSEYPVNLLNVLGRLANSATS